MGKTNQSAVRPAAPRAQPARTRLTRAEAKAQRTQQLLDAAWELFCERGYEALTIDHVAERAGYSRMPIYSLFGDKQNLFFELWRAKTAQLTQVLIGGFAPGASLRRNIRQLAEVLASRPMVEAPMHAESMFFVVQTIALSRPDLEEKLQALARKVIDDFAGMIRRAALEKGDVLRGTPEVVAAHMVAHINGMANVKFQTGGQYTKARDLVAIFNAIAFKSPDE
ncbi:MAG TPA: TetR/AcrR family transcriptional regulator [Nevskiaceae bacterium]|nr:TetR/AcrR family transcriptional regulator [Nevskiaceae bacterium]